ncbi:serine/threonine protein kinase, partial [Actinoplanes philippinensis]
PHLEFLPPEVLDLCSRCLARDPAERPTALVAALLLAEAVDARVYVPLRDLEPADGRPPTISPWTERAAAAPTSAVAPDPAPSSTDDTDHIGRHRA